MNRFTVHRTFRCPLEWGAGPIAPAMHRASRHQRDLVARSLGRRRSHWPLVAIPTSPGWPVLRLPLPEPARPPPPNTETPHQLTAATDQARFRCSNCGSSLTGPAKLTPHQQREAIKRRDRGGESLADIGRSYNASAGRRFPGRYHSHHRAFPTWQRSDPTDPGCSQYPSRVARCRSPRSGDLWIASR